METSLFAMINVEPALKVTENGAESVAELVTRDDVKLRQVGGGVVMVLSY